MKPGPILTAALAIAISACSAWQTRPDFSGTWLLDTNRSIGLPEGRSPGDTLVVTTQTATQLVMQWMHGDRIIRGTITYALDGSESDSTYAGVRIKARSRWEGDRLITEGTQTRDSEFAKFKEVRELSDKGQTMVVEMSFSKGGGTEDARRTVFKRSAGR